MTPSTRPRTTPDETNSKFAETVAQLQARLDEVFSKCRKKLIEGHAASTSNYYMLEYAIEEVIDLRTEVDKLRGELAEAHKLIEDLQLELKGVKTERASHNIDHVPILNQLISHDQLYIWSRAMSLKFKIDGRTIGDQEGQFYYIISRLGWKLLSLVLPHVDIGASLDTIIAVLREHVPLR